MAPRTLKPGQICQVWIHDTETREDRLVFETCDRLFEAPNWTLQNDALILNGDGLLWRCDPATGQLSSIPLEGLPPVNNDHVLDPNGRHIFASTNDDGQIYRVPLAGGHVVQITGKEGPKDLLNFLHGVSPNGKDLAYVGVLTDDKERFASAEICVIGSDGQNFRQLTDDGVPTDGPEYSPDGAWIYFNTEAFSGHAQIARMRPDGSDAQRLTYSKTVDWFPHMSPDGQQAVYLAYPEGTEGHPANKPVKLMLVEDRNWTESRIAVSLFGGQGTINVNSWSPDSRRFAYVSYPMT